MRNLPRNLPEGYPAFMRPSVTEIAASRVSRDTGAWTSARQNNVRQHHPGKWEAVRELSRGSALNTTFASAIITTAIVIPTIHWLSLECLTGGPRSTSMYLQKHRTSTERGPNKKPRKPAAQLKAYRHFSPTVNVARRSGAGSGKTANSLVRGDGEASLGLYCSTFTVLAFKTLHKPLGGLDIDICSTGG